MSKESVAMAAKDAFLAIPGGFFDLEEKIQSAKVAVITGVLYLSGATSTDDAVEFARELPMLIRGVNAMRSDSELTTKLSPGVHPGVHPSGMRPSAPETSVEKGTEDA